MAKARDRVLAASIDGSAGFGAQDDVATDYGIFTINRNGGRHYRQALNPGDTLHDLSRS